MDDSDLEPGGERRRGAPRRIGRYRVLDEIGRGGMAVVYRAVLDGPRGFAKEVCLKRVLPGVSDDPSMIDMFVREARLAADLRHANVVQVFDFDVIDDTPFLVMELVDGASLYELFRGAQAAGIPVPIDVACGLGAGILAGLQYVHTRTEGGLPAGLVHRDVSLHNVLVSRNGEVKVADFGIARAIGGGEHTRTGVLKGKIAYIAPEYVAAGHGDHRADLFSAGVVLHELLSGRRRTAPPGSAPGIAWLLHARLPPLRDIRPDIPDRLSDWVAQLTSPLPGDRPADAAEALRRLGRAHPVAAPPEIADFVRRILTGPSEAVPAPDATAAEPPIPFDETLPTPASGEATLTRHDPPSDPIEPTPDPFTAPTDPLPSPPADRPRGPRRRRALWAGGVTAAVGLVLVLLVRGANPESPDVGAQVETAAPDVLPQPVGSNEMSPAASSAVVLPSPLPLGAAPVPLPEAKPTLSPAGTPDILPQSARSNGVSPAASPDPSPDGGGATPLAGVAPIVREGPEGTTAGPSGATPTRSSSGLTAPVSSAPASGAAGSDTPHRRGTGRLTVRASPWAMVRIDGGEAEEAPVRNLVVPAGRHRVEFEYEPMSCTLSRWVTVPRDGEATLQVDMRAECPGAGVESP